MRIQDYQPDQPLKQNTEIIRSRMKPYVEAILAEEQAWFRPGRSTVEQVFFYLADANPTSH